jgi:shikimate kinase
MQGFVDEAHEEMLAVKPTDSDATKAAYLVRWQQREAMYRGITDYVAQCDQDRQRILEEIEEREKEHVSHVPSRIETA